MRYFSRLNVNVTVNVNNDLGPLVIWSQKRNALEAGFLSDFVDVIITCSFDLQEFHTHT